MEAYYLGFNLTPGIGPVRLRRLLEHLGSPQRAWQASAWELRQAGLEEAAISSLLATRARISLDDEMARVRSLGIDLVTWDHQSYPEWLRHIYAPPPLLYVRGSLVADEPMVALVGTRQPTTYGREVARRLAASLARNGVTVVSGLALGIDTEAHQGALAAGGRTVAVLASGVDQPYPLRNRGLAARIVEQGALVSDYPPGTPAERTNFPPRNRIISGLSRGVVVVEAGERSGALITSDFAAEQGRDVLAVPGQILSPTSLGCHNLLAQGARLVRGVDDILDELNLGQAVAQAEARRVVLEDPIEATVLESLSVEPRHVDEIGLGCNLPAATVASTLMLLELKGLARHVGGMLYVRS